MRTVNIAELKNSLSKYITYAKGGEETIIRDRNLPVARLIPFIAENASAEELELAAAGIVTLPQQPWSLDRLEEIPIARLKRGSKTTLTEALLKERREGR